MEIFAQVKKYQKMKFGKSFMLNFMGVNPLLVAKNGVSTAWIIRLLDCDLQSILRAKEDFDINRVPFVLEA